MQIYSPWDYTVEMEEKAARILAVTNKLFNK